jgi:hypothetical protein
MHSYSFLQQIIHHLVLGNKLIKKSLFEIEKILFDNRLPNIENGQHVFVTGLPRSGTTILLEFLYKTNAYASLTYSDMPFILSPNLFSKIIKRQDTPLKERMHKDGIKINLQSPEAFDDVFFQTFNNDEIKSNLSFFISLILQRYDKKLYLSKNNNNYKRIDLLHALLPDSIFILPFRGALQHANSLLSQHKHFCELHEQDKFISQYMSYLGHFEFGSIHHSWNPPKDYSDPLSLNYWLEQWLLFYEILSQKYLNHPSVIFISYEALCNNRNIQNRLLQKLNLDVVNDFSFSLSKKKITENYDESLLSKCTLLENKLNSASLHSS